MKSGNLNFVEPSGPLQACNGTALPLPKEYVCCLERGCHGCDRHLFGIVWLTAALICFIFYSCIHMKISSILENNYLSERLGEINIYCTILRFLFVSLCNVCHPGEWSLALNRNCSTKHVLWPEHCVCYAHTDITACSQCVCSGCWYCSQQ